MPAFPGPGQPFSGFTATTEAAQAALERLEQHGHNRLGHQDVAASDYWRT